MLEEELKHQAKTSGIKNIIFRDFLSYEKLLPYYLASDVFILPTREDVWGLVVNEAMSCGLPVICSKFAGCCSDLVVDGITGYRVDPFDTERFYELIIRISKNKLQRSQMSENARKQIENYTCEKSAGGFLKAIEACIS